MRCYQLFALYSQVMTEQFPSVFEQVYVVVGGKKWALNPGAYAGQAGTLHWLQSVLAQALSVLVQVFFSLSTYYSGLHTMSQYWWIFKQNDVLTFAAILFIHNFTRKSANKREKNLDFFYSAWSNKITIIEVLFSVSYSIQSDVLLQYWPNRKSCLLGWHNSSRTIKEFLLWVPWYWLLMSVVLRGDWISTLFFLSFYILLQLYC